MKEYDDNAAGSWICNCGKVNTGKFCVMCGSQRPAASTPQTQQNIVANGKGEIPVSSSTKWVCTCGKSNSGKFCVKCGALRPNPEDAVQKVIQKEVASRAAEEKAAQETATRKESEEKAAQETDRHTEETHVVQEEVSVSSAETDENKVILKKVAIGVTVLLVLIGAYFMFDRKKETPPTPAAMVETKNETGKPTDKKVDAEKSMDPTVKAEKLKEYAEMLKTANAEKRLDATTNEKIVFLVNDVKRNGNDLVVSGHFYNGKKNRTITSVKSLQLDIILRDMDKELLNEKNIKYEQAFIGIRIEPLQDSQPISLDLPGKAPAAEFNNYVVTVHNVHWEGVGN